MIADVAHFPEVNGFVLSGRRVRLPDDLAPGLVVVAFKMWHQRLVDEWIAWAQERHPDLPVVEVPVISRAFRWQRPFIDGGMIAGIRDRAVLSRTITVYTDVATFLQGLDVPDDSTVVALLTGPDGAVRAKVRGPWDRDVADSVISARIEAETSGRTP